MLHLLSGCGCADGDGVEFGDGDCDCVGDDDDDGDDDEILSQPFGVLAIEAGSLQLLKRPYWLAERTYRPAQLY